jgi:hypothetical protein
VTRGLKVARGLAEPSRMDGATVPVIAGAMVPSSR